MGVSIERQSCASPKLGVGLPVTAVALDKHAGLTLSVTIDPTKEPFLRDHQIDGIPVLPGVMGLELFAQAATLLSVQSRCTFRARCARPGLFVARRTRG